MDEAPTLIAPKGPPPAFLGTERYRIVRPLGAGGHGTVYEAVDETTGERVALKTLETLGAESLVRFKRSFRALAEVHHPNLVSLYELESRDGAWFFTMELVHGVDLVRYIRAGDPSMPELLARTRATFLQLCDGLAALHRAQLVHRDVKPENLLVDASGRLVVIDFGVVAELRDRERHAEELSALVGTPKYMAPEQICDEPASAATDWYALGVVLFEALTGQVPFAGEGLAVLTDKLVKTAPPVSDLAAGIPAELERLCAELLAPEAADRPDGSAIRATLEGRAAAKRVSSGSGRGSAAALPFVGRDTPLRALEDAMGAVRPGHPVVACVSGSSGMGKSELVERFLARHASSKGSVLRGRSFEHETTPFKAFDGIVDTIVLDAEGWPADDVAAIAPSYAAELTRLFPVLGGLEPWKPRLARTPTEDRQLLRTRAFVAYRELIAKLRERRTLILFLDDIQWSDDDSAALLETLLAPPDPPGVLVVLGYRAEHEATCTLLARARALAPLAVDVRVGPLGVEDAGRLVREVIGRPIDGKVLADLVTEAGGSPFFIGELARLLRQGAIEEDELHMESVVDLRVRALPPASRRILELASIAARPTTLPLLSAVAGLSLRQGAEAARTLHARHLFRGSVAVGHFEPFHDKIREGVCALVSTEDQARMHRRFVDALEAAPGREPERLHWHCRNAGLDDKALDYALEAAAAAAQSLAFGRAAELFSQAIAQMSADDPRRPDIREQHAHMLAGAGRVEEAGEAYLDAAEGLDLVAQTLLESQAAEYFMSGGHVERGFVAADRALAKIGVRLAPHVLVAVLLLVVHVVWLWVRGTSFRARREDELDAADLLRVDTLFSVAAGVSHLDPLVGAELLGRATRHAVRLGEPGRVGRTFASFGIMTGMLDGVLGRFGMRLFRRAEAISAELDPTHPLAGGALEATRLSFEGLMLAFHGRWSASLALHEPALALYAHANHPGFQWERRLCDLGMNWCHAKRGDLVRLREHGPRFLREVQDAHDRFNVASLAYALHWLALADDDPTAARSTLDAALEGWPTDRTLYQHGFALLSHVDVDLYEDRPERAQERVRETLPKMRRAGLLQIVLFRVEVAFAEGRVALALGAREPHARAAGIRRGEACARRLLARSGDPWAGAMGALLAAGVASLRGAPDAADAWERAAVACDAADMSLHAGAARVRRGEADGGATGERTVEAAVGDLGARGVRDARRLVHAIAPAIAPAQVKMSQVKMPPPPSQS